MEPSETSSRGGLGLKRRIAKVLRDAGLDPVIYYYAFVKDHLKYRAANAAFRRAHPELILPPARLMFDVSATTRADYFADSGKTTAAQLWAEIEKWVPHASVICEWGCGPGRVLFPLAALGGGTTRRFFGTDMYAPSIRWAQSVPNAHVTFQRNAIAPPLPMPNENVDFVYAISVFTHLAEGLSRAWFAEIMRVLRPGGVFWFSAHGGQRHWDRLDAAQQAALARGEFVAIHSKYDGSQAYCGIHCPEWMRALIATCRAELLEYRPEAYQGFQDVWLVRKPATPV